MEFKENIRTLNIEEDLTNSIIEKNKQYFLGVRVDNITREIAFNTIKKYLSWKDRAHSKKVFFTNVHTVHLARSSSEFRDTVNNADLVLADGSGLSIAGKLFSKPIKENLNGTDFTPRLLKEAEKEGWSVYMFGARPAIIEKCVKEINRRFPNLKISGYHSGYYTEQELPFLLDNIANTKPDILLVAMGSPIQEMFIENYADRLNTKVSLAVGGLFDFISGDKKRAPLWLRKIGMEWVYRFFQDPMAKWNRIFVEIPKFLLLIVAERISQYFNSVFRNQSSNSKNRTFATYDK